MNHNPIAFLFDHWQSGVIGLSILGVVLLVGVVVGFYLGCKDQQK